MKLIKYLFISLFILIYIVIVIMFVFNNFNILNWDIFSRFAIVIISLSITYFTFLFDENSPNNL